MSDVAAGSNAALQLQQNIAAAPNVQQVQQNVMQEKALKLQQEAANVQTSRLANTIAETGIQADADIKNKIQGLVQTPDYLKAEPAEQQRKLANIYMQAGKAEEGSKLLKYAEDTDAKELSNKQKTLDLHAQELGNAFGVLEGIKDETKFNETVSKFPPEQIASIKQQIPNWDNFSPTEKKEALKNLMLNAKGQLTMQIKQLDYEKALAVQNLKNESEVLKQSIRLQIKAMGLDDEGKSFNSATSELRRIEEDAERSPERKALVERKEAADRKSMARFGSSFRGDTDEYIKAKKDLDDYDLKTAEKKLRIAVNHKPYTGQEEDIKIYRKEVELLGGGKEEEKPKAKETPAKKEFDVSTAKTPEQFAKEINADKEYTPEQKKTFISRYKSGYEELKKEQGDKKVTSNKPAATTPTTPAAAPTTSGVDTNNPLLK